MPINDFDDIDAKRICSTCIGDSFLSNLVKRDGLKKKCDYCDKRRMTISIQDMAEHIKIAFETHYRRTDPEPDGWEYAMMKDKESDYDWERKGESTTRAIMEAAKIPEEAANDIQELLEDEHRNFDEESMGEECEFSSEAHYEITEPPNSIWYKGWQSFEKTIKSEARFFSKKAEARLSELFGTIDTMITLQGQPVVIDAGQGTQYPHLYRAREFQPDDPLKSALIRPDVELGAPPSHLASAGRMNARGISVFYGATSIATALAEVRPIVGSKVAVARFEIIRPIRLLDLTALRKVYETGSVFDPEYAYRRGRANFLKELSNRMTQPVMPKNKESDYLPTQAIADYLATESKVELDGILYPSVQAAGGGLNIVLFHKASRCKALEFPKDTQFKVSRFPYDKDDADYHVMEEIPPNEEVSTPEARYTSIKASSTVSDKRKETLSIDLQSVTVHHIKAVHIDAKEFRVTRDSWHRNINF